MTEIERILREKLWLATTDEGYKETAKAIEQYVLKARIEELENCGSHWEKIMLRIAELKKGLKEKTNG